MWNDLESSTAFDILYRYLLTYTERYNVIPTILYIIYTLLTAKTMTTVNYEKKYICNKYVVINKNTTKPFMHRLQLPSALRLSSYYMYVLDYNTDTSVIIVSVSQ